MKKFNGYEETQTVTEREKLPVGAYPVVIKAAEEKTYSKNGNSFSVLEISFDISDGEFKDFFADDYRTQTQDIKKWKGVLRQFVPKDDNSEKDNTTKSFFKTMISAIEDSNPGFHWDWEEAALKGKKAACVFRNEEWQFNGANGWKAQPFKFITMEAYTTEKYRLPKDKPLKNKINIENDDVDIISDDDLPF